MASLQQDMSTSLAQIWNLQIIFALGEKQLSWYLRITSWRANANATQVSRHDTSPCHDASPHHDASLSVHCSLKSKPVTFLLSTMYVLLMHVTNELCIHTYIQKLQPLITLAYFRFFQNRVGTASHYGGLPSICNCRADDACLTGQDAEALPLLVRFGQG
jgi:hypothetical protein